jgi:4-amino-4-deoxy-L-arabinose transferase-like glycosyltransferase
MPAPTPDDPTLHGTLRLARFRFTPRQLIGTLTAIGMAVAALYLNFFSALAGGIPHRFATQADIIRHGFDPTRTADASTVTYPMWGYGWLYLITDTRLALMAGQMLMAVIATVLFVYVLYGKLSDRGYLLTGFLTAVALPWYCLHATISLYSPAAVLLVSSIALLIEACERRESALLPAAASGVLFGLCLNFRSDFLLMPVGVIILVLACRRSAESVKYLTVWVIAIAAMMVPWVLYTWHTVGQPRITSTNGGHALFIGLGQLPGNSWGITPIDTDPLMRQIIDRELGPKESTLGLRADGILKREFRERIKERPAEFARKMAFSGFKVILQGAYPGEFLNTATHRVRRAELVDRCKSFVRGPLAYLKKNGSDRTFRLVLIMASYGLTVGVVLSSFLVAPVNAWFGIRRGNLAILLVLACIAYHWLLQAAVFNLPHYTSSHLVFHIANLGFACDTWLALRTSGRT